jgi:hypothetical protein
MKRNPIIIFAAVFILNVHMIAQDKPKFLILNGYLSTMQSVQFDSLSGQFINDNIIHNRLNFKGYISDKISFAVEARNRLFTGDMVRTGKSYSEMIGKDQGLADMSWNIINEKSFFLNTTIDRIWMNFNFGKIEAKIGRQRINWGQTLVWNPNDIFNAYSFFDFDYVERSGSDAIRIQYFPGSSSSFEIAVKSDYKSHITAASLFRFNRFGYDFQFLAGCFNSKDIVAGAGWSGAIGSVSFRGEASWFQSARHFSDSTGTGIFTISAEKSFKDNSMAQIQVMYCNSPVMMSSFNSLYLENMSTRDLAISRFSAFGQYSYQVTPLFKIGLSAIWYPDLKGYFAGPTIDYSLSENVDFSLFWQHFDGKFGIVPKRINLGFLRVKFSF